MTSSSGDARQGFAVDDDTDRELLAIVAARGSMVLSGNRESFEVLRRRGGGWLIERGETMEPDRIDEYPIADLDAARRIRARIHDLMARYRPEQRSAVSGDQLVAELREIRV